MSAFGVGGLWAVILVGYEKIRKKTNDILPAGTVSTTLQSVIDSIIVGGGSGATLWLVHWHLSAVEFGAASYLLVGGFLFFRSYWPLSESEAELSSTDR
ncbi:MULTISPECIES: hypothetical protein [Halomicrobium]|uniref:Uncharacterized protein n=2 Tax=Halomicrobium mukohataei TaxID=57705 RepID=C7NXU7_HALMD|nr:MULTISPECIES: hypothetical protein [Halomicrobium]ACV46535.1 hypothetical protein Hmuk_0401 [Halomicrobium mukohataei DSM 12286]QCD65078.1 hypothetical protein E5139_05275 [Halomicrobium mukohataei]QFR19884.1 hypothetical protein GBQ70_05270 [Halomicrobium sp. ZPS1]